MLGVENMILYVLKDDLNPALFGEVGTNSLHFRSWISSGIFK